MQPANSVRDGVRTAQPRHFRFRKPIQSNFPAARGYFRGVLAGFFPAKSCRSSCPPNKTPQSPTTHSFGCKLLPTRREKASRGRRRWRRGRSPASGWRTSCATPASTSSSTSTSISSPARTEVRLPNPNPRPSSHLSWCHLTNDTLLFSYDAAAQAERAPSSRPSASPSAAALRTPSAPLPSRISSRTVAGCARLLSFPPFFF